MIPPKIFVIYPVYSGDIISGANLHSVLYKQLSKGYHFH